jgi:hypothetical protein
MPFDRVKERSIIGGKKRVIVTERIADEGNRPAKKRT